MPRYIFRYIDECRGMGGRTKSIVKAKSLKEARTLALKSVGFSKKDFPDYDAKDWSDLWEELQEEEAPFLHIREASRKGLTATRELDASVTVVGYVGTPGIPTYKGRGPVCLDYKDE